MYQFRCTDEPVYMVGFPLYLEDTKRINIPKEMKKQSYASSGWGKYFFRVTKKQYDGLTGNYFKAEALSQKERVHVSYFIPELMRTYSSQNEFPDDFDMDRDDLPELCIEGRLGTFVIKYIKDIDQYRLWWESWESDFHILGSRKLERV